MRHSSFAVLVIIGCNLAVPASATADVEINVDVAAPFTEDELHEAVRLRHSSNTDAVVVVAKLGNSHFVVSVNGRSQLVELTTGDQSSAARVVALVVVSLIVYDRPAASSRNDEKPPLAKLTRTTGPNRLRLSGLLTRDDNGYEFPILAAAASHPLSPHTNIVASAGIGKYDGYSTSRSLILPLRVGIEGQAGAAGIELGGQMLAYRENSCGAPEWGNAQSVYGAARVFLPISGSGKKLVAEVGGHLVLANLTTECKSASTYTSYGGWVGLGLDWPL
jgi:hypothetical protein